MSLRWVARNGLCLGLCSDLGDQGRLSAGGFFRGDGHSPSSFGFLLHEHASCLDFLCRVAVSQADGFPGFHPRLHTRTLI